MILFVNACVREASRTRRLAETLLRGRDEPIEEVRPHELSFPSVDGAFLERRDRLAREGRFDDPIFALARQFARADEIVIAAPYWDLSFPAALKQYLEQVTVAGVTFRYAPDGTAEGLCRAKKLTYVTTAGGSGVPTEYGFGYVRALGRTLYGIREIKLIKAEGLDLDGADAEAILRSAMGDAEGRRRGYAVPQYSEQDLRYAAELREEIHREALAIVRKTRPYVTEVIDRHSVEDYFQEHWDYPGKWYTVVAIPYGYGSRKALVDTIVRDTLSGKAPEKEPPYTRELRDAARMVQERSRLTKQLDAKPDGYRELFVVEINQKAGRFRAVGEDSEGRYILEHCEEYRSGDATGSISAYYVLTDLEYGRYARLALVNGQINEAEYDRLTAEVKKAPKKKDALSRLLAEYPDLEVEYEIVKREGEYAGYASHRAALKTAFGRLDGEWDGDPDRAEGERIDAAELFSSERREGKLNYRRAFLRPPHGHGYNGEDFARVNEALFPNGTDGLEVYEWTTDWSDYFDEGHEWWGALCLTVYDQTLDRFAVILASATD
ncbi:MAG: NAD(P)H-dependent oxidoreductase [Oscillibacter sp.]|nr:NAD(P)H-dependent oxidoreductase [Oscillibacter sp.]